MRMLKSINGSTEYLLCMLGPLARFALRQADLFSPLPSTFPTRQMAQMVPLRGCNYQRPVLFSYTLRHTRSYNLYS